MQASCTEVTSGMTYVQIFLKLAESCTNAVICTAAPQEYFVESSGFLTTKLGWLI